MKPRPPRAFDPGALWIRALLHLFPQRMRRNYGEALLTAYLDQREDLRRRHSRATAPWVLATATLRTGWQIARSGVAERWSQRNRRRRVDRREEGKESMLATLIADVRYALRGHRKRPGLALLAIITLALGVGSSTAIFSVVNGVLLRPLPFPHAGELVSIQVNSGMGSSEGFYGLSEPEYLDFESQISSFSQVAVADGGEVTLGDSASARRIRVLRSTASLFPLLRVDPLLGRAFTRDEDVPGAPRLAILSYGMWETEFGGDRNILGRSITIADAPVTVIGVMPASFEFPGPEFELYTQIQLDREDPWERNNHYLDAIARLSPGTTLDEARAEVEVMAARATEDYPVYYPNTGLRVQLRDYQESIVGGVKTALYVLLAAVGFVLLTVCVNVANLLLARGEVRKRELAIRGAIGASNGRIARQLFTESLVLAVLGGLGGVAVAMVGIRALLAMAPASVPRLDEIGMDFTVLGFSLLATLATGLLFGVMPSLQAGRRDVQEALKEGGGERGPTGFRQPLRRTLVAAQVMLAVVLVTGSGLMLRSVANLYAVDMGFATEDILTFRLTPRAAVYDTPEKTVAFWEELLARANSLPGVRSAAATYSLPMTGGANNWSILIEGHPAANIGEAPAELIQRVTPEYLEALGLTLVEGRWFTHQDDASSPPVVVVSEAMARKHWPGEDPIGKRMKVFPTGWPWLEVVGVVKDVRHRGPGQEPRPRWYVPHAQAYRSAYVSPLPMTVAVRTETDPTSLVGPMRALIEEMDPSIPISELRTMDQILDAAMGNERFVMTLLTVFGLLALFLAAVGVYGVVSYTVSRRTHEIGLRMALGARGQEVLGGVMREGLGLALLGIGLGLAVSFLFGRVFESLVFGIEPTDPLTYLSVAGVLLASVAVASLLPARRASRISPVRALREE
jgi:putative ABC transport system permease protein